MADSIENIKKRIHEAATASATPGDAVEDVAELRGRGTSRLTVNLIPKSVDSLDELAELTGLSKTDVVNRALQVYAFLEKEMKSGGKLLIDNGREVVRVEIL